MRRNLITLFLLISLYSLGQEKQWTANQCMQYAIENSPKIKKSTAQNRIFHQDYLEALGRLLPKISASTSANFNFGRGVDAQTNTYMDINSFSNGYGLHGSITLFDGFSSINRLRMEQVNKLMGKQQLQQYKDELACQTLEAFMNVLYYKELVTLAQQQLSESNNNLKQVQRMEELGIKGFPDIAEMRAKQAEDQYNLTKQKNLLAIGIILLKEKMNFPINEALDIDTSAANSIVHKEELSALDIYTNALAFLPKAKVAATSLRTQELAYRSAKGGLFPTISADAGYTTNFSRYMDGSDYKPFKEQLKDKRGRYVGITLSIPIFSGFSRSANLKRGHANLVIARADHDETLRNLYSEIEQAVTDLNGLADEYAQAVAQQEAMQAAQDVNQRKYEEGLISPLELHTSANRLQKAKTERLNAQLKYQVKQKLVNYYQGKPLIEE